MWTNKILRTIGAVSALALGACGGGDSTPAPGALSTVVGPITGFGSVIVNGVRFDDANATVTIDDALLTRDRLRLGMVVQVRGRVQADGTGVADSIRYDSCVEGPITAMNRVQNTVTVLGQTVHVDDGTVFDGVTLRDMNSFAIGDLVEISCLPDPANDGWRATRMERRGTFVTGVSEVEVGGLVSNLNLALGTCLVGGTPVDFSGIAPADRPAGLANGMTIDAKGRQDANGIVTADRLRDRDRDRINTSDGDGMEVEGYVSSFVSLSNFKVDSQAVNAANAVFANGTAADLRNGLKVEVEGTLSGGVLVAKLVVIRLQSNVRIEAGMQKKDMTGGTVTLLGRPVRVNADTVLIDRTADRNQPRTITLAALNVADRLEVKGYKDGAGNLVAAYLERTEADPLVVVKAAADAKTPTTQLTLAGINVATGASTRYRDVDGNLIDATSFYRAVQVPPAVPTSVHARGVVANLATNVVDATRSTSTIGELEIGED